MATANPLGNWSGRIRAVFVTNLADFPGSDGAAPGGNVDDVQIKASATTFGGVTGWTGFLYSVPPTKQITVTKGIVTAVDDVIGPD